MPRFRRLLALSGLGCTFATAVQAQTWPDEVTEVRYLSAADDTRQPALFFAPKRAKPAPRLVPLLVGLHTWSGGFKQGMSTPYADWCVAKGWAFIHPHFRGPNRTPQATGSDLAVADIVSAIEYAKRQADVDPDRVYLIGTSLKWQTDLTWLLAAHVDGTTRHQLRFRTQLHLTF